MNILLFDNTQMVYKDGRLYCVGGTGKFAKELVELGNEVTMYGQKIEDPASIADFDIEANGVKTVSFWRGNNKILDYLGLYWNALKTVLKSDFVYIYYPTSYKYFIFLCWLIGKKFGLYVRGTVGVQDWVSILIYKRAYVVFTVSQTFTDMVNSVNSKKMAQTIRPMVDFTEKDAIDRVYKERDIFSILMFCRIEKEKGIDELLNAVKILYDSGRQNFRLTVAGGGGYLDEARRLSNELQLGNIVQFKGSVNDPMMKRHFFETSDIYILPTYHEGFPRTLYEAMLYGTPIVTTLVGGIPALMKDGINCKAIKAQSVNSIVYGLSFAMDNYDKMITYAQNGKNTVVTVVDSKRPSHAQDVNKVVQSFTK
ncbi:MAG: glycosyltransferase family 4 protein [Bacteroidales bacterium]|nr:glycosyltransferase family 4 protein [Bacteroidales bacterium]